MFFFRAALIIYWFSIRLEVAVETDWSCMIKCFKVESNESGTKEETCTIYLDDLLLNNTVTHPLCEALKIAGIYPVALGNWLLSQ